MLSGVRPSPRPPAAHRLEISQQRQETRSTPGSWGRGARLCAHHLPMRKRLRSRCQQTPTATHETLLPERLPASCPGASGTWVLGGPQCPRWCEGSLCPDDTCEPCGLRRTPALLRGVRDVGQCQAGGAGMTSPPEPRDTSLPWPPLPRKARRCRHRWCSGSCAPCHLSTFPSADRAGALR